MPIGTRYVLCGILRTTLLGHLLEVEQGEWWQLDIPCPIDAYAGRRILAEGIRTGAHRLTVEKLTLDEENGTVQAAPAGGLFTAMIDSVKRIWR